MTPRSRVDEAVELLDLIVTQATFAEALDWGGLVYKLDVSREARELARDAVILCLGDPDGNPDQTWRAPYMFAARALIRMQDGAW